MQFVQNSEKELQEIVDSGKLQFYKELPEVRTLIEEVLELNPHSVHTLTKHKEGIYGIALDNLNIVYSMDEAHATIDILKITHADNT